MNPAILILRPLPAAMATAERARTAGLTPLLHPLFQLKPVGWNLPREPATALLLTSANALRLAGPIPASMSRLPAFAVGPATASKAREAGLHVVFTGSFDGAEAMRAMGAAGHRTAVHLRGQMAHDLPGDVRLLPVVTYAAEPTNELLPPDLAGAVVLLHSPRAAALFADRIKLTETPRATLTLVAISAATAEAAGSGWRRVEVAKRPADGAMVELAARLAADPA